MRPLTAGLNTSLANDGVSFARACAITRVDGTILRFAELQDSGTISGDVYVPVEGFEIASIASEANGGPTRIDVKLGAAPTGTVVDRDDVRDGLYNDAQIVLYLIDHRTFASGKGIIFGGDIGEVSFSDRGVVVFECVGILGRAKVLATEHRTPTCRNWFGDERCGVALAPLGVSTTAASDASGFSLALTSVGGNPDQHFKLGTVEITSGPSAGRVYEVRDQTGTSILTYTPFDAPVEAGDAMTIYPGCDYTNGALGCLRWSNCINQQADPFVPGQDARNINYREWGS